MLYELGDLKLPALPVLNEDIVVTREEVPGMVPAEEEHPVELETAAPEKPDEKSDEKSDEESEEKPESNADPGHKKNPPLLGKESGGF